jgi:hypothetical protein
VRVRVEALGCKVIGAADDAQVRVDAGLRTTPAAVAAMTKASAGQVGADLTLWRWLERHPFARDAFCAGQMSLAMLRQLKRADRPRLRGIFAESEPDLVSSATDLGVREYAQVMDYWLAMVDQDGPGVTERVANRGASIGPAPDQMTAVTLLLDPVNAQVFTDAVEREQRRLAIEDHRTGTLRTGSQRRADAIMNLIRRGSAEPDAKTLTYAAYVIWGSKSFEAALAKAKDPTVAVPLDPDDPECRCEFIDGTPVDPMTALGMLADSVIRRIVLSGSEIIDLGRKVRCFPPVLRDAIRAAARGRCATPGCDSTLAWGESDHIERFEHGGTTSLANSRLYCRWCNHQQPKPPDPPQEEPPEAHPRT